MENLFIVNGKSIDAKFTNIINKVLFGANHLLIDDNTMPYSNDELLNTGARNFYFVDVLPDLNWIQSIIEYYPQAQFYIFSKLYVDSQYVSVQNNVHIENVPTNSTYSLCVHTYLKNRFLTTSLVDKTVPLYFQLDMLVQFFNTYCTSENFYLRGLNAFIKVMTIIDGFSNDMTKISHVISRLNITSEEEAILVTHIVNSKIVDYLSTSFDYDVIIQLEEDSLNTVLKCINVQSNDFLIMDKLLNNFIVDDENLFIIYYKVVNNTTVECKLKHSKNNISIMTIEEGQDFIDYVGLTKLSNMINILQTKFELTQEQITQNNDGTLLFNLPIPKFFDFVVVPEVTNP